MEFYYYIIMISLNSNIINEFSKSVDNSSFEQAYNKINQYLNDALTVIKNRNPYIINYDILIANEAFSDAEFFGSTLDIFVALNAVQIELNQTKKEENRFVKSLKCFFQTFKENLFIFSSKKSKNKKYLKNVEKKVMSLENYNVTTLYNDLLVQLSKLMYNKTELYINNNKISIVGEEEFGLYINIYPVFYVDEDKFKLYNINTNKNLVIDFKNRFENIDIKNIQTDDKYINQVRIFNNIYWNIFKQTPNQIFIESLINYCPNNLFVDDIFETTINIVNFIKNESLQNVKSICDNETNIFDEQLNTIDFQTALKFINKIEII